MVSYSKWDDIEVSDEDDEPNDTQSNTHFLDQFLAMKDAAMAQGLKPERRVEESARPPTPPPMHDRPLLAVEDGEASTFADGFDGPWAVATLDSELIVVERSGRLIVLSSEDGAVRRTLTPPELEDVCGIAATNSAIFVTDCGRHCVHKLALADGASLGVIQGVQPPAMDADKERAMTQLTQQLAIEEEPPLNGLRYPRSCVIATIDERTCLLVSDSGNRRVLVYDVESLEPVRSIGWTPTKPVWDDPHAARPTAFAMAEGGLNLPMGMCIVEGTLYVVDGHEHRLCAYELADGSFQAAVGGQGSEAGRFRCPFDVLECDGRLVVTEGVRLQVLEPDGTPNQILELPTAQNLAGIALSADGRKVFVCDHSSGSVAVLTTIVES